MGDYILMVLRVRGVESSLPNGQPAHVEAFAASLFGDIDHAGAGAAVDAGGGSGFGGCRFRVLGKVDGGGFGNGVFLGLDNGIFGGGHHLVGRCSLDGEGLRGLYGP